MALSLKNVEATIFKMDKHYDANFGSWIRNEKNAAIIGHHLNKYIDDYNPCDFIIVLKWIVRSWTLRSIITLSKTMALYDIQNMSNSRRSEAYIQFKNRTCVLSGLIYTWNNVFVAEFLITFSKALNIQQRCKLFVNVFSYFEKTKNMSLIGLLEGRIEERLGDILMRACVNKKAYRGRKKRRVDEELYASFATS